MKDTVSAEKKRARDRRAQQTLRDKRIERFRQLEKQVAALTGELAACRQQCDKVTRENRRLRALQQSTAQFMTAWSAEGDALGDEADPEKGVLDILPHTSWSGMIPCHLKDDAILTDCFAAWRDCPELVLASPEEPRPIDLICGSRTNFLADVVHKAARFWSCNEPERLAGGWLMYQYIRWILWPDASRFASLIDFLHPVQEQLEQPHPYFIDFICWPQLRANLISKKNTYEPTEVLGMCACSIKVRWPFGESVVEPDEFDQLRIRDDFRKTFTRLDGWILNDSFTKRYPSLVEGLDL